MALFLFKDFWEEGDGRYWEFTENGIFKGKPPIQRKVG